MTRPYLSRTLVLAVALLAALAMIVPPSPSAASAARDARGGGYKAMHLSSGERAKLRKNILSKHYRPGRPALDPGFGRPFPGHGVNIRREIRREIRKDIRQRYFGRLVAGVVLGAIINVRSAGRPPGAPPGADLCWVWSDRGMTRGYWYYCDPDR